MNERNLRDSLRESEIQRIKARKFRQNQCNHRTGESGLVPGFDNRLAFHALKLPTGEIVAVCPYCQKMISSIDPSDKELFSRVDLSRMAESIQFLPEDDDKLFKQLRRYTPEEKDRVLKETIAELKKPKTEKWSCIQYDTQKYSDYPSEQEMREMPLENLKVLAEDFVKKNYKRTRKK